MHTLATAVDPRYALSLAEGERRSIDLRLSRQ
jgi:hypothetical protein